MPKNVASRINDLTGFTYTKIFFAHTEAGINPGDNMQAILTQQHDHTRLNSNFSVKFLIYI